MTLLAHRKKQTGVLTLIPFFLLIPFESFIIFFNAFLVGRHIYFFFLTIIKRIPSRCFVFSCGIAGFPFVFSGLLLLLLFALFFVLHQLSTFLFLCSVCLCFEVDDLHVSTVTTSQLPFSHFSTY